MATFWQILSVENRNRLAKWYEETFGCAFLPPGREGREVHVEPKLESLEEIGRLMRQKPNPVKRT